MIVDGLKNWSEIGSHIVTIATALAAGWWFFLRGSTRRRIELDAECSTFIDPIHGGEKFVELTFVLRNKGQVENRCYILAYEVQSVEGTRKRSFVRRSGNLVPREADYYYVRAGVTILITAHFWIPTDIQIIRVKAFILYENKWQEVPANMELFEAMNNFKDWTALDRVFELRPSKSS